MPTQLNLSQHAPHLRLPIGDTLGTGKSVGIRPSPLIGRRVTVTADGIPIAYSALQKGVPVVAVSGREFGTVEHVLEIPAEDLFDGIVVSTGAGLRFVDRDQIELITTTSVRCALTDEQVADLSPPNAAPVFSVNPAEDAGSSLHDRFGRMFRRPHWKREV